jgi:hypothetical protein
MLKSLLEHPLLCVTQMLALLIALPAFFSTMSFTSALTPEQAVTEFNKPLPTGWTAGVMNHGDYYRWWTIQERPILFGISVFFLVMGMLFIYGSLFWIWKQNRKSQSLDKSQTK